MAAKKKSARKYGKAAAKKVQKVMREKKAGTLRSGSGQKVTKKKQALAIALSEARKSGAKVPKKKTAKKATKKKAAKKKTVKKASKKKATKR